MYISLFLTVSIDQDSTLKITPISKLEDILSCTAVQWLFNNFKNKNKWPNEYFHNDTLQGSVEECVSCWIEIGPVLLDTSDEWSICYIYTIKIIKLLAN